MATNGADGAQSKADHSMLTMETPSTELDLPEGVPLNGHREDDEASSQASEEGASALSSVFTLCNSCIGAGVLSLPYAFMKAGILSLDPYLPPRIDSQHTIKAYMVIEHCIICPMKIIDHHKSTKEQIRFICIFFQPKF